MLIILLSGVETGGVRAVVALIFTALLGIAGYIVQSKNAADADRVQHEIVQEAADREQARVATDTRVIPTPLGAFRMKNHK